MKKFKTESKKMLDMMINSIYTNKEIFIRELLSNSSDAIDKLYFNSLQEGGKGLNRDDFSIRIDLDKENRILKISDNGIGMTKDELENNLGTIAKSGSLDFKSNNEMQDDINIIGQFGVGFYSVFMVADSVQVLSRAYGADLAYEWSSQGVEGYDIKECEKEENGTEIVLHIKENSDEESFDEYLEEYKIKELIKNYSNYIRYPIEMMTTKSTTVDDKEEEIQELETINDMVPIWKKQKSEIKPEEYNDFYKQMYFDMQDPAKVIHTQAEGAVDYKALLFIPAVAPHNYYTKSYEKGLKLYTNGVLITEKCAELLPDHFSFVKGLVDSELTLNISRETIQHDRRLKLIAKNIEKKIKKELLAMQKNDREKYEEFFKNFGLQLKYGIYSSFGMLAEELKELLMFYSLKEEKMVTLQEYVEKMPEEQKFAYYANGNTIDAIKSLPQVEKVLDSNFDVLAMTEEIDELTAKAIGKINEKEFKSVASADLGIDEAEEAIENQKLVDFAKEALGDKVVDVKLTSKLKKHPVCLVQEGEMSLEMEKVFSKMPNQNGQSIKANKILEINTNHAIYSKMEKMLDAENKEDLKTLVEVLFDEALLIQGLEIENHSDLADKICKLIAG